MKKLLILLSLLLLLAPDFIQGAKKDNFVPLNVSAGVCGIAPSRETILGSATYAVKNAIRLEPGAQLTVLTDEIKLKKSAKPDIAAYVAVPVKIGKGDEYSFKAVLDVSVKRRSVSYPEDNFLIVSNDPEDLPRPGTLVVSELKAGESARLLYHHRAMDPKNYQRMLVVAINPTEVPAEILFTPSVAGPDRDEVYIGHIATTRFMQKVVAQEGMVLDIPPLSSTVLISQGAKFGEIVSALAKLALLSGQSIVIKVIAEDNESASITQSIQIDKTFEHGRLGATFGQTSIDIAKTYTVGSNLKSVRIGDEPYIRDPLSKMALMGNYGIFYRIHLTLKNPTEQSATVGLFFAPAGGIARGNLIVNGALHSTGMVDPKNILARREKLAEYSLPANSTREYAIITMPQPGSYYPVKLVLSEMNTMPLSEVYHEP